MTDEKEVLKVIYEVIDLHNGANSESYFIEKKLDTPIFSKNSNLDSLGLTMFLIELETRIKKDYSQLIEIFNEDLFIEENSPYKNIQSLNKYITEKINSTN